MGTAVPRVELQRALVVLERQVELARVTVSIAEVVLDVGIARVAQRSRRQQSDCAAPVLCLDGLLAAGVVGVELEFVFLGGIRLRANGAGQRERERQPAQPAHHHFRARYCFISRSSARSPSALRVRRASWLKYPAARLLLPAASAAFAAPYKPRRRLG